MIKIKKDNKIITIEGHAEFKDENDIVCASVSSIMYTTVNAILNFDSRAITYEDDGKIVKITVNNKDDITLKLIDNMMLMFDSIKKDYPSNIEIN